MLDDRKLREIKDRIPKYVKDERIVLDKQKKFIEDFQAAKMETAELLGKERAKTLIEEYYYEKEKRTTFTYELGEVAMQNKAQTSLQRAKIFSEEIRKILQK